MIGLGKMGGNMVKRLRRGGDHRVVVQARSKEKGAPFAEEGAEVVYELADLVKALKSPRIIWLMVPAEVVGDVIDELVPLVEKGDIIVDGGKVTSPSYSYAYEA